VSEDTRHQTALTLPAELPVLPLLGIVVYPLTVTPLGITQESAIRLVDEALAGSGLVGLVARRDERGRLGGAAPEDCFSVGVVAHIHRLLRLPDGALRVAAEGLERFAVTEWLGEAPVLRARVRILPDEPGPEPPGALAATLVAQLDELIDLMPGAPHELRAQLHAEDDLRRLSFLVAQVLMVRRSVAERQEILALPETSVRLERLSELARRELRALRGSARMRSDAPPASHQDAERTETLAGQTLDLERARQTLAAGVVGQDAAREALLELLAARELRRIRHLRGPAALMPGLAGPAGGGKSTLARALAQAAGLGYARVALGELATAEAVRGRPGEPGALLRALARAGSDRVVLELDGLDQLTDSAAAGLIALLDSEASGDLTELTGGQWDLEQTLLVGSARAEEAIPALLRERLDLIRLPAPTLEQRLVIARAALLPRLRAAYGLLPGELELTDAALQKLVIGSGEEPGLRALEQRIARLCRRAAAYVLGGRASGGPIVLDAGDIDTNQP
jgi:ATP-dependent Lon protease